MTSVIKDSRRDRKMGSKKTEPFDELPRSCSSARMRTTHLIITSMVAALFVGACDQNTGGTKKDKAATAASFNVPKGQEAPADVAKPPADAKKTAGGVAYKVLAKGKGKKKPEDKDSVRIEYTAWTADGKPFSSSKTQRRPARVGLTGVVPGLSEVLKEMVQGEECRIWIPAAKAEKGWPNAPTGRAITMEVKLLQIIVGPKKIPVPEDVGSVPNDAKKSKSGLAWKVLKEGTGKEKPSADQTVKVHYSGWTTDGKMFDSSITRGKPGNFSLRSVIPGWTEGLQLMVEGEKRRFWIPVELAYNNRPNKPKGMLVFDVELIEIDPVGR